MSHVSFSRPLIALALLAAASPLHAQRSFEADDARWAESCRDGWGGYDDRGRACEVRAVPVKLAGHALDIDGRQNGGIRVVGWGGDSVRVTARIQTTARDDDEARALIKSVKITADGRRVSADGPSRSNRDEDDCRYSCGRRSPSNWSVSYVVYVPRHFDLQLDAHNGGIDVSGVTGKLDLRTTNGSVSLTDIGGDVHARTQNGSLNVQLAGSRWDGSGLDAETQNGAVRMSIPESYAASIETGTVNGRVNTDFPVTLRGRIGRQLNLPLNGGGAPLRAMTTNGSVTLSRK
jgi:hypothetical protein